MKLLEMSISASILILLLALLRAGGLWKLPKRIFVLLWMVVLIRLLVPVSLPVQGWLAAPAELLQQTIRALVSKPESRSGGIVSAAVPKAASSGIADGLAKSIWTGFAAEIPPLLCYIWIAGFAGFSVYFAYSYFKEYRLLAQALPLKSDDSGQLKVLYGTAKRLAGIRQQDKAGEQLFTHDRIMSPLVWGTFKQRIVFPKAMVHMEQAQMKYVLAHEMVHVRRRDNFWKLLSAAAVCIHWFNPMAWAMYFLFARDLELSCDERVIALYGSQKREEYARALLTLAQDTEKKTLFCSGFGRNPTKERIMAIMKYKKLTGIGFCCAVMLIAGATSVFATSGKAAAKDTAAAAEESLDVSYTSMAAKSADTASGASADGSEEEPEERKSVEYVITDNDDMAAAAEYKLVARTEKEAEEEMLLAYDSLADAYEAEFAVDSDVNFTVTKNTDADGTVTYIVEDADGNIFLSEVADIEDLEYAVTKDGSVVGRIGIADSVTLRVNKD